MNSISSREIEKSVDKRTSDVFNIQEAFPKYLMLDEKFKSVVDKTFEKEVIELCFIQK